jgi:chorismate mutase
MTLSDQTNPSSPIILCRGVRGATTAAANTREAILEATTELAEQMIAANDIHPEDVASVFLSMTPDLNAVFPAVAFRALGWTQTALLCLQDMVIPTDLPRAIRILIHWNTALTLDQVQPIYINGAEALRPDLAHTHTKEGE